MEIQWGAITVAVVSALVSLVFGLLSWGAKRELKSREEKDKIQDERLNAMDLFLREISRKAEGLIKELVREEEGRRRDSVASIWSAVNQLTADMAAYRSESKDIYLTQREFEKLERLKEKQEQILREQNQRLEANVDRVLTLLSRQSRGTTSQE